MGTTSIPHPAAGVRGKIIEAEIKISVDATKPLPMACALYAIESPEGIWLCAYYGANRSNFDYLPQKGAEADEARLGIAFHERKLVPKDRFSPEAWAEFMKSRLVVYGSHQD